MEFFIVVVRTLIGNSQNRLTGEKCGGQDKLSIYDPRVMMIRVEAVISLLTLLFSGCFANLAILIIDASV